MRAAWMLASLTSLLASAGCTIGSGSGDAQGDLTMLGCNHGNDVVGPYDLHASFFVGDAIDSTSPDIVTNQLEITMQRSASRPEFADGVTFEINDTFEVGRCVQGHVNADGSNDWNTALCDRSSGVARIFIGTSGESVRASFTPYSTCVDGYLVGTALGSCADGVGCPSTTLCPDRNSWIEFATFGSLPDASEGAVGSDFTVAYGQRLSASAFHLGLCDSESVTDVVDNRYIDPPRLTGTLDGDFDFDLTRGQAGQPFP